MDIRIKKLIVKYNGHVVGTLVMLDSNRIAFQYDNEWLVNGFSISPFSLPLSNEVYISKSEHFGGLFGVFSDSLPDGWGELLVRRMLAKKGINFDNLSPLVRLTLVSDNGLGGLSYEPVQTANNENQIHDLDGLSLEIQKILENTTENVNLDEIFAYGGSSGGARPKAHLKDNKEWIVKFASSIDPKNIGELEFKANHLMLV